MKSSLCREEIERSSMFEEIVLALLRSLGECGRSIESCAYGFDQSLISGRNVTEKS